MTHSTKNLIIGLLIAAFLLLAGLAGVFLQAAWGEAKRDLDLRVQAERKIDAIANGSNEIIGDLGHKLTGAKLQADEATRALNRQLENSDADPSSCASHPPIRFLLDGLRRPT